MLRLLTRDSPSRSSRTRLKVWWQTRCLRRVASWIGCQLCLHSKSLSNLQAERQLNLKLPGHWQRKIQLRTLLKLRLSQKKCRFRMRNPRSPFKTKGRRLESCESTCTWGTTLTLPTAPGLNWLESSESLTQLCTHSASSSDARSGHLYSRTYTTSKARFCPWSAASYLPIRNKTLRRRRKPQKQAQTNTQTNLINRQGPTTC